MPTSRQLSPPTLEQSIVDLAELVSINTGSHNQAGLQHCATVVQTMFDVFGIPVQRDTYTDSQGNTQLRALLYKKRTQTAKKRALLSIHLDTVFEPESGFLHFTKTGDTATGPGVIDAKGGLVILYNTLCLLETSSTAPLIDWTVVLTTDEETGSQHSKTLLMELARTHDIGLVFEPACENGALITARPASTNLKITAKGRAAHAGRGAATGINALTALLDFIQHLQLPQYETASSTVNLGRLVGGTKENIIPADAYALVNARFMSNTNCTAFIQTLTDQAQHYTLTHPATLAVVAHSFRPAKPTTAASTALYDILLQTAQKLAIPLTLEESFGVCDGNFIAAAGIPVIDTLGANGTGMHTHNETIELRSLLTKSTLAFECLKEWINTAD